MGDSLTEMGTSTPNGWATILGQYYSRRVRGSRRALARLSAAKARRGGARSAASRTMHAALGRAGPKPAPFPAPRRLRACTQADIINRGFGGYTTSVALAILPEVLETVDMRRTALALVWYGANDATNPDGAQ